MRNDIIITLADKGGALVIIDVNDYVKEAHRQLKDKDFYAELTHTIQPVNMETSLTKPSNPL